MIQFLGIILSLMALPIVVFSQVNLDYICEVAQYEGGIVTTGMYQAGQTFSSDANIALDATVIFSDFSVPQGSCFLAEPVACESILADVTSTSVSGNSGQYQFSATIESPDTGCCQYANWWEVISTDGVLIYRRVLGHSHVNEQPFTRSGGPVNISATDEVYVRAWMNPTGYGGKVMKGSVANGFVCTVLSKSFAEELRQQSPLPGNCPF